MAIDFQDPANARTYSDREADPSWDVSVGALVDPAGRHVVDVGCGGGTYARAWLRLGAARVTGVDSSPPILDQARADAPPGFTARLGNATATGLPDGCADLVFERALVHHTPDLDAVVAEALRLLGPGGALLVQDRTVDDVLVPGGPEHPRGLLLAAAPRLRDVEAARRPDDGRLRTALRDSGFDLVEVRSIWETRRVHPTRRAYLDELAARTGRSVLHELDDAELAGYLALVVRTLPDAPVVERDRWTVWHAVRPA